MKRLIAVVGLAAFAACGSADDDAADSVASPTSPSPTTAPVTSPPVTTRPPVVDVTLAPASSVPSSSVPATVSVSTATPSTSPPASDPPRSAATSGTAVVYASAGDEYAWLPVGWWDGSSWGSVEWPSPDVVIPAPTFDALSVASVEFGTDPLDGVTDYTPATYGCVDDTGISSFELALDLPDVSWWGYRALAVTSDWDVQPRTVSAVGLDAPEYQELGESLVPNDQPVDPSLGDVEQVLRADLDGNGVEEVLLTFQHLADPRGDGMGSPGDFSLVIARYPDVSGTVVDEVLAEHVVPTPADSPFPDWTRVMAIADLNGDGTMEVALASGFWESVVVTVYEFSDGGLHEVMTSGCGV